MVGKVDVIEGVPTIELTRWVCACMKREYVNNSLTKSYCFGVRSDVDGMSIKEVKKMLFDFGLTDTVQYKEAIEKSELVACLVDSGR